MAVNRLLTFLAATLLSLGASWVPADTRPVNAGPAAPRPPSAATPPGPGAELAAFEKAIRELYDMKERAWAAGDAETIVTRFYAPDAVSVGEGDPTTMVGREQFRATYRKYVKDVTSIRIESVRTVVNGNAGWDWTHFYSTARPEKAGEYPPPLVRVLFLWSKENGRWVCKGDVFVNGGFDKSLPRAPVAP